MRSIQSQRRLLDLEHTWRRQTRTLTLREGVWKYSRTVCPDDPSQGWKIHLSATILSANEVFARVYPILRANHTLFKIPDEFAFLTHLNSGDAGFSQIGKFITVYTKGPREAVRLAQELHAATRGLPAPEIPFDVQYRRNGLVYYRYGSFVAGANDTPASIFDLKGKPRRDRRAPKRAVPHWLDDPFRKQSAKRPKPSGPIGLDYFAFKALAQRGKGGVFEALDLSVTPARLVVIKQGRRHGDTDWNGEDGFVRVRREGRNLKMLLAGGIPVPRVFREFMHAGNYHLVLEKIPGRPLLPRKRQHPKRPSWQRALGILDRIGILLYQLHEFGWVWRDCKPPHIFLHQGTIRLIDFEGACRLRQTDLLPWGSPDYTPPMYLGKYSRRAGTLEDDHALGAIAFQFATGEFPSHQTRSRSASYKRAGCPDFLRARIETLLCFE